MKKEMRYQREFNFFVLCAIATAIVYIQICTYVHNRMIESKVRIRTKKREKVHLLNFTFFSIETRNEL